ncbi:uncharacterized protein C6orf132 homolog [Dendropsophus ebraccatus]|uniref:uncharacterized protein C6orf132 homolog n=1 Tax=Dendropsophus ebraccatus TaxID=150705 RepID=UPI0038317132
MRIIFLLMILDIIHPSHCGISCWINTILSHEIPMEIPPPPPPTKFADFSLWLKNLLSYDHPIEEPPPPPPPTMVEEFLYWIDNMLSVPVQPAHRRTRERCIGNNPSKSTGPWEKPSIIRKMYKRISATVFGEPPPPVVPAGCRVTLRDWVLSGVVYGLLISPIFALVVLAAWLSHEQEFLEERADQPQSSPLPDIPATVPEPETAVDVAQPPPLPNILSTVPVRAADEPQPSLLPDIPAMVPEPLTAANVAQPSALPDIPATAEEQQNAERLNASVEATSEAPETPRAKKSVLKPPSPMGARKRKNKAPKLPSSKRVTFNKMVHVRPIPPNHRDRRARSSEEHQEREFVEDPMSVHDRALQENTPTE